MSKHRARRSKHNGNGGGVISHAPASPSKKIRVLVAVPTLRWASTVDIASLMMKLGMMSVMPESPWEFSFRSSSGLSGLSYGVDYQRNLLVNYAVKDGYDWIWFVDSDVLPGDNFVKLLALMDRFPVVAGIYPLFGLDPEPPVAWTVYRWWDGEHRDGSGKAKGFVLANFSPHDPIVLGGAAGTGCMLISRKVFTDPRMLLDKESDPPALFKLIYESNGKLGATEDIDFCKRLRDNGYTLAVHTDVKWGHVKTQDVRFTENCMRRAIIDYSESLKKDPYSEDNPLNPSNRVTPVWEGEVRTGNALFPA